MVHGECGRSGLTAHLHAEAVCDTAIAEWRPRPTSVALLLRAYPGQWSHVMNICRALVMWIVPLIHGHNGVLAPGPVTESSADRDESLFMVTAMANIVWEP